MTAKPVPEHISDERLLEALKPFAALGQYLIDHGFITKPDDAGLWGFDDHTLTYGDFRAAAAALTELQHRREAEAGTPEGWVLVPRDLTLDMEQAHYDAHAKAETVFASAQEVWAAMLAASPSSPASGVRVKVIDWQQSPPFITSISGDGSYEVNVKVHSMAELHAAHDLVLKAFSDAHSDLLAKRWADANQG